MAGATIVFNPGSSIKALLEQIYAVKFSKHVPLVMILLFAIFAVWRTDHYVSVSMHVGLFVSAALAICIEIAMLAAGASCFIAMREAYIRELRKEDAKRASLGSYTSYIILAITTIALMTLAGADGAMESSGDIVFILLMIMIQFVQSGTMLIFISTADLILQRGVGGGSHWNTIISGLSSTKILSP